MAGDVHRQPELAATLRMIARQGRAGFYEGEVAEDMVRRLKELGGVHSLEDFAATKGDYIDAGHNAYRGHDIHQMPPNNQGLTALLMLNILTGLSWRARPHRRRAAASGDRGRPFGLSRS